jgi:hypothetical protein
MEKAQIIKELINRKVIKEETEVEVEHWTTGFGTTGFNIKSIFAINQINNDMSFVGRSIVDGKPLSFDHTQVHSIDGMEPAKLAKAFNIK